MDVLQKRYPPKIISPYVNILKYKNSPVELLGTGGNESQNYPSDIDLFSKIITNENAQSSYEEFNKMIDEIEERDDMFFVEFKVQQKNGNKFKFMSMDEIRDKNYEYLKYFNKDIDYCKFDFILLINGMFIELSIIYVFNKDPLDYDVLKLSLSNDMIELIDEDKYYKSLKRLFAILKLDEKPDKEALVNISRLFNSAVGELYKKNSVLKAIKLYQETYPNEKKLPQYVFKNLGFKNIDKMDDIIKDYDSLINREGYKFYMHYYPYLLKIKNKKKPIRLQGGHYSAVQALDYLNEDYEDNLEGGNRQTGSYEFQSRGLPQAQLENALYGGNMKLTEPMPFNAPKAWEIINRTNEKMVGNQYDY